MIYLYLIHQNLRTNIDMRRLMLNEMRQAFVHCLIFNIECPQYCRIILHCSEFTQTSHLIWKNISSDYWLLSTLLYSLFYQLLVHFHLMLFRAASSLSVSFLTPLFRRMSLMLQFLFCLVFCSLNFDWPGWEDLLLIIILYGFLFRTGFGNGWICYGYFFCLVCNVRRITNLGPFFDGLVIGYNGPLCIAPSLWYFRE